MKNSLVVAPAQDIAGVSCKDDSHQGSFKKDKGPGRRASLTHWLFLDSTIIKVFCFFKTFMLQGNVHVNDSQTTGLLHSLSAIQGIANILA